MATHFQNAGRRFNAWRRWYFSFPPPVLRGRAWEERMKDENGRPSLFILLPSSFILHPFFQLFTSQAAIGVFENRPLLVVVAVPPLVPPVVPPGGGGGG
jgi:hypothetical protein